MTKELPSHLCSFNVAYAYAEANSLAELRTHYPPWYTCVPSSVYILGFAHIWIYVSSIIGIWAGFRLAQYLFPGSIWATLFIACFLVFLVFSLVFILEPHVCTDRWKREHRGTPFENEFTREIAERKASRPENVLREIDKLLREEIRSRDTAQSVLEKRLEAKLVTLRESRYGDTNHSWEHTKKGTAELYAIIVQEMVATP